MPKLHLVGTNKNMTYKKLHGLQFRTDMPITCHCVKFDEKVDWKKMKFEMKTADIVLVLIGSKGDYNILNPIGHFLSGKSIFVIEDFPDRERCLNKEGKALLVDAESYASEVVEKMIDIIMYDSVIALDYQDIFNCTGWRTTVTYRRFPSGEEALAGMKMESQKIKGEMAEELSLLFVDGNFSFSEVWDIVTVMDGDKEGNYVIGCSYEEGAGFGVLWFRRDHEESEKAVEKWGNPFKKHKVNWFKIGFFVSTLVCLILGAKLLVKDSAERNEVANTKWENPGLLIISVKTAMQDVSGLGMVACHRDVVELHGEEYEAVAKVIEKEFSTNGMKGELELLSYFGRAFSVSDLSCKRIDGEVISFLQEGHYSVDGVGGTIKEGYTYSVKKGVMLTMSDVLVRERSDEFYQIIDEYIVEALSKHPDVLKYNVNAEQEFQEKYGQYGKISAGWLLSEEGMVFLFREGDFGPGFVGPIEVTVPYSKLGSYIRTKYQR